MNKGRIYAVLIILIFLIFFIQPSFASVKAFKTTFYNSTITSWVAGENSSTYWGGLNEFIPNTASLGGLSPYGSTEWGQLGTHTDNQWTNKTHPNDFTTYTIDQIVNFTLNNNNTLTNSIGVSYNFSMWQCGGSYDLSTYYWDYSANNWTQMQYQTISGFWYGSTIGTPYWYNGSSVPNLENANNVVTLLFHTERCTYSAVDYVGITTNETVYELCDPSASPAANCQNATQSITFNTMAGKLRTAFGYGAQSITFNTMMKYGVSTIRNMGQAIKINTVVNRLGYDIRNVGQAIKLNTMVNRLVYEMKNVGQAINFNTIAKRVLTAFRYGYQSITFNTMAGRLRTGFGTVSQSIKFNGTINRLGAIIRNPFQTITFQSPKKIYDFNDNRNHAYNYSTAEQPPISLSNASEQEFTSYQNIKSPDGAYYTTVNDTLHPYQRFNIIVNDSASSISELDIDWLGHSSYGGNAKLYIWDYMNNSWDYSQINNTGVNDFWLNYSPIYSGHIGSIVNTSGNINILVQDPSYSKQFFENWETPANWPNTTTTNWSYFGGNATQFNGLGGNGQWYWTTSRQNMTTVNASSTYGGNGTYWLIMDSNTSGSPTYSLNELTTTYNFFGAYYIYLNFSYYEQQKNDFACNNNQPWTNHTPGTCVAFTCDGWNWYPIVDLSSPSIYTSVAYNISASTYFSSYCGKRANSSFAIRFQQTDNDQFPTAGLGIDNINVSYSIGNEVSTDYIMVVVTKMIQPMAFYNRVETSILNFGGMVNRVSLNFKYFSQSITFNTMAGRLRTVFSYASQNINFNGMMNKLLIALRKVTQSIILQTMIKYGLSAIKNVGQAITFNTMAQRILTAFRYGYQSITFNTIGNRMLVGIRNIPQSITFNTMKNRLSFNFKYSPQSLTFSTMTGRLLSAVRNGAQSITFNMMVKYGVSAVRNVGQAIKFNSMAQKILAAFKYVTQSITFNTMAGRLRTIIPSNIWQSIAFNSMNKLAIHVSVRIPQQLYFNILLNYNNLMSGRKSLIQILTMNAVANRLAFVSTKQSQSINFNTMAQRILNAVRNGAQSIMFNTMMGRLRSAFTFASQSITFNTMVQRILIGVRKTGQAINFNTMVRYGVYAVRNGAQSITFNTMKNRLGYEIKNVGQSIIFNSMINRVSLNLKYFSQPITFSTMAQKALIPLRNGVQSIMFNTMMGRLGTYPRTMAQSMSIKSAIKNLGNFYRGSGQAINIGNALKRSYQAIISAYQQLFLNGLYSPYKNERFVTEAINMNGVINRWVSLTEHIPQSLTFNGLGNILGSLYVKFVSTFLTFFSSGARLKTHAYPSAQYVVNNLTDSGSQDVEFYENVEVTTDGQLITLSETLPPHVGTWEVHRAGNCGQDVLASGIGNIATWSTSTLVGQIINNSICYNYTDGITLGNINWVQNTTSISNQTTQYVETWVNFTNDSVDEPFMFSWEVNGTLPNSYGSQCYYNCTGINITGQSYNFSAFAYGNWINTEQGDYIQGDAWIMQPIFWTKSVFLSNIFTSPMTFQMNASALACYTGNLLENYVVNSTNQNETLLNYTNMLGWNVSLGSGNSDTWTMHLKSQILNLSVNNSGIQLGTWYRWMNITNACDVAIKSVNCFAPYNSNYTSVGIFDNNTGTPIEQSSNPTWNFRVNATSYMTNWTIPSIPASTDSQILLMGKGVNCTLYNRTILNAPLYTLTNVEWLELVKCDNLRNVWSDYSEKWRIGFDDRNLVLDNVPIDRMIDNYGAYITVKGSLPPLSSDIHNISYVTDPVTAEVTYSYPPDRGESYYVDTYALVNANVTVKSWTEADINTTITKEISIIYGKNLNVYLNESGNVTFVDAATEVTGKYDLNIPYMKGGESRLYMINFSIPTVQSSKLLERPDPQTGLTVTIEDLKSITPYVLTIVRYNPDISYNQTTNVTDYITNENLSYTSTNGNDDISVGSFNVGQDKQVAIWWGQTGQIFPAPKWWNDFINWWTTPNIIFPFISYILNQRLSGAESTLIVFAFIFVPFVFAYYFAKRKGWISGFNMKIGIPGFLKFWKHKEKEKAYI